MGDNNYGYSDNSADCGGLMSRGENAGQKAAGVSARPATPLVVRLPDVRRAEVPIARIFMVRGQRIVVVGPCPYCGGQHEHRWQLRDRAPGSRVAPCTARTPGVYELVASPEQVAGERSRRRGSRPR